MRSLSELNYLVIDFIRYLRGRDYFRQPQPLGAYFRDTRCYYNDLRGKANWTGPLADGVPLLHVPALGTDIEFPIMVLLYGLGSLDCYFVEASDSHLHNVRRCVDWMLSRLHPSGCFDNNFSLVAPAGEYYSSNSGMTNGLALSFALRVVHNNLVDTPTCERLGEAVKRIVRNTLTPVESGGTVLEADGGTYLMEHCVKSGNVVLNGWIYGVFGLWDVQRYMPDNSVARFLDRTLETMVRALPRFYLQNGWTRYDLAGRTSSPFYHRVHCALLDALCRLTHDRRLEGYLKTALAADTTALRCRYTFKKIRDRLTDRVRHMSTRASRAAKAPGA
jgi:hypothetical protein